MQGEPIRDFFFYYSGFIVTHFLWHNRTKERAEAVQSFVLGNCGLGSLPKGTMWNRTHDPSAETFK